MKKQLDAVDQYLKNITPPQRAEFERVRKIVRELVPDAEESITYGVPTFKYNKKYLIYFGGFKDHMSLYPASDAMVEAIGPELAKFRVSKGTLRFTEDKPIPSTLIKKIIAYRLKDIWRG